MPLDLETVKVKACRNTALSPRYQHDLLPDPLRSIVSRPDASVRAACKPNDRHSRLQALCSVITSLFRILLYKRQRVSSIRACMMTKLTDDGEAGQYGPVLVRELELHNQEERPPRPTQLRPACESRFPGFYPTAPPPSGSLDSGVTEVYLSVPAAP